MNFRYFIFILLLASLFNQLFAGDSLKASIQNPSPMQEKIREHKRISNEDYPGKKYKISGILPSEAEAFIPEKCLNEKEFDLLVHFHGASYIVNYAASEYKRPIIAVTVNLGAGSSRYSKPFRDETVFNSLVDSVMKKASGFPGREIKINRLILTGFSAGYGAIRELLSQEQWKDSVDEVILLDGIHASYVPEGLNLYDGGKIDSTDLAAFLSFARKTASGNTDQKFLITHSEIFPGTYVSTTEATQFILDHLGIKRKAVLEWGPLGMQKLAEQGKNNFKVISFAGNAAPDHVDHLHALYYFLNKE